MSLALGLIAALAWGIHDLCVRHVSQTTGIYASIIAVLAFGCVLVTPVSIYAWGTPMGDNALMLSLISGILFGLAAIALYKAFAIGPVRLVAPIIGAYPVLSLIWAVASGGTIALSQWMAAALVIMGVGYVAGSGDQEDTNTQTLATIGWSVLAGATFALTFAVGQQASADGGELALLAPTRFAALATMIAIVVIWRLDWWPDKRVLWILALMGALDAVALACVISAGGLDNPEFAAVAASIFGLVTVVLAAIFLREKMTVKQWVAVAVVFGAIAYLGL